MITEELAEELGEMARNGASIAAVAKSWGHKPGTLYKALKRHNIDLTRDALTPDQHLDMQIESGTPPELYAQRAGMAFNTLRRWAWDRQRRLAMNTFADRKAYWLPKVEQLEPTRIKAYAAMHMAPVPMLAHWYHRLLAPQALLLWGFNDLLVIGSDQFSDFVRYSDPRAELYAIGQGKNCAPVGAIVAGEAFKHARTYQQH